MFKRDFTIMVCSHSGKDARTYYLPRTVLVAVTFLVFSAAVCLGAVVATLYHRYLVMATSVGPTLTVNRDLVQENGRLERELSTTRGRVNDLSFKLQKERDDYAVRLEQLDANLKKIEKFYTDLRIIAGFKLDVHDAKRIGAGGPTVPADVFYRNLYRLQGEAFSDAARDHELTLRAECSACEQEYGVLLRLMERRRSLLADTPNMAPVKGIITSWYGARRGRGIHAGLDIGAAAGTPIYAPADGVVRVAGPYPYYGNVVMLDHGAGFSTRYGHLSRVEVKAGDRVERGDIIGRVGATGWATGNHLHYEVRINNVPVDPFNYLKTKLPVHIVDGSKLEVVELPDNADLLIPDEVFQEYEAKGASAAEAAGPGTGSSSATAEKP